MGAARRRFADEFRSASWYQQTDLTRLPRTATLLALRRSLRLGRGFNRRFPIAQSENPVKRQIVLNTKIADNRVQHLLRNLDFPACTLVV